MKKHVYREGDKVRIVRSRFVKRVGYALHPHDLRDEMEADPRFKEALKALGYDKLNRWLSLLLATASKDPMALPLIDPNFLSHRDDVDRLIRGFKLMRGILSQPALAMFGGRELATTALAQTDEQIEQVIRDRADSIYHPVGTCRMGNTDQDVVDAQLRVRGIQGLRVVDASIMPCIVSGNTNAPVMMIAEKAADMIKASQHQPL